VTDGRAPEARRRKVAEVVARELTLSILDGELPAEAPLPTEREMMDDLGVGRPALREALRLLEDRGVLEIRLGRNGGPVVRHPGTADFAAPLALVLAFQRATLDDILVAREAIEPAAAGLAALRRPDEAVDELRRSAARILEAPDDHDVMLRENAFFHARIADLSGNAVLRVFIDSVKSLLEDASLTVDYPASRRQALGHAHDAIVESIAVRDAAAATEAMRVHLVEARSYWRDHFPALLDRTVRQSL